MTHQELIESLEEIEGYFDNKSDGDYEDETYIPNKEGQLLNLVREIKEKLRSCENLQVLT